MTQLEKAQIKFERHRGNPVIPRTPGSFFSVHAANPDILPFQGKYYFYFRGQAEDGHDQIGVGCADPTEFDGINWQMSPDNPVIPVSKNPSDFDSGYIVDPATIELNGSVYLYYTGHSAAWSDWNIPSYIGLAISDDGIHFMKSPANPIIEGTEPEVVAHNGRIYLFFQRKNSDGYFEIYCCQSQDGICFDEQPPQRVFGPSNRTGAFDKFSISTTRIWSEGEWFYMTYGGCPRYFDYPAAIGLARSRDLLQWQRYPDNPILERGQPGTWDEGAVWFATVFKKDQMYYLWYEGTGTGMGLEKSEYKEVSRVCREKDYGGYGRSSFSQIGLATYVAEMPAWP
ncbi:hypothetical protein MJD09_16730 [bacterium]|nr:hypothetical protein [bacterium]